MTALDQAFIKAYTQQDASPASSPLCTSGPVPLAEALEMHASGTATSKRSAPRQSEQAPPATTASHQRAPQKVVSENSHNVSPSPNTMPEVAASEATTEEGMSAVNSDVTVEDSAVTDKGATAKHERGPRPEPALSSGAAVFTDEMLPTFLQSPCSPTKVTGQTTVTRSPSLPNGIAATTRLRLDPQHPTSGDLLKTASQSPPNPQKSAPVSARQPSPGNGKRREFSVGGHTIVMPEIDAAETIEPTLPLPRDNKPRYEEPTTAEAPPAPVAEPTAEPTAKPKAEPFQAMLQVERFSLPKVCRRLQARVGQQINQLTERLIRQAQAGHRVVAFEGCREKAGVSSLLLSVAHQAAQQGQRVIVVDTNFCNPRLAEHLGILPEVGLETVLSGQLPLEEVVVEAARSSMAILPLCPSCASIPPESSARTALRKALETLAGSYDLVLVAVESFETSMAMADGWNPAVLPQCDVAVLVQDVRSTPQNQCNAAGRQLKSLGVELLGIVDNFVDN